MVDIVGRKGGCYCSPWHVAREGAPTGMATWRSSIHCFGPGMMKEARGAGRRNIAHFIQESKDAGGDRIVQGKQNMLRF